MSTTTTNSCFTIHQVDSVSSFLNYVDEEDSPYLSNLWEVLRKIDNLRGKMSKQELDNSDIQSDDFNDENLNLPQTCIVIHVAANVKENTLSWLLEKIKGKRRDGGAELIVLREPQEPNQEFIFHISASKIKFLEAAEEMEIMKEDKNGLMREFSVGQIEDFMLEDMHIDDVLTMAEKQTIVRHELENIRALLEDKHIPGYPACILYEGQSVFQASLKANIITKVYPLHDQEALKKLGSKWYMAFFNKQPIEEIRLYFGESIALYFTFLGFYTLALLLPLILGLLQLLIATETMHFFCLFNVVWVTIFLEIWKRKSNSLAFKWGTIGMTSLDEPRANFYGSMGYDSVTGKLQPQYPRYITNMKMYCVSIPIVFLCMIGAFIMMLGSFWAEDYVRELYPEDAVIQLLPSIVYAILVCIVNLYYRELATYLTEWENHRTQSQYDRHRVTKLVLFEFVNTFMALFYIAFIMQDMEMLKSQVQIMLIIQQAINNIQETIFPLVLKYYTKKLIQWKARLFKSGSSKNKLSRKLGNSNLSPCLESIPQIPYDDSRLDVSNCEGDLDAYEGTYDDYLELFIQFGYVFLFSSVYPIAALWAVLNNFIEIRADAFKLCKVSQRPMNRRVKDIGAWQRWFEVLGAMSIITNCGLLALSPPLRATFSELSSIEWILWFVFLEHLLLGLRYLLHIGISERPEWVRVALAKRDYESRQALKFERSQRNKRLLTRKFKTIHGLHNN